MVPDKNEHELRVRLAADLEILGSIGDPTRGPVARYYLPPQSQVECTTPRAVPSAAWRRSLAEILAQVRQVRLRQPKPAWSPVNEHRPAEPVT